MTLVFFSQSAILLTDCIERNQSNATKCFALDCKYHAEWFRLSKNASNNFFFETWSNQIKLVACICSFGALVDSEDMAMRMFLAVHYSSHNQHFCQVLIFA